MCSINGILSLDGHSPVSLPELRRTRDAMARRGPDGIGEWVHPRGHVAFGHRRLAIIDLSTGASQPMALAAPHLQLVFNGEIYNYRELRGLAEQRGALFRTQSDTEVLLHLYAQQGPSMLSLLRGMYALAIWDDHRQGVFLARDPYGIKPLYFSLSAGTLRFASQVRALVAGGALSTDPDPAGHVGFFLLGSVPEPHTLYRDIRALPAGAALWADRCGVKQTQHAALNQLLADPPCGPPADIEEARERLRAAIGDSVRAHLAADVDVGVFLSAGLDSTSVAAVAQRCSTRPVRSVTLGFRELSGSHADERMLAARVATVLGLDHTQVEVRADDFRSELNSLMTAMDQPSIDGVNTYFVSKAAASLRLKVALSGLGGDEVFGGYPSFVEVPAMARIVAPFSYFPAAGQAFRRFSRPLLPEKISPKYASVLEFGGTLEGAYLLRRAVFMPWEIEAILGREMTVQGWQALDLLNRLRQTFEGLSEPYLKMVALESSWFMRNQLLRDADWAGMAHSLEIRTPFVDIEFLRAMAGLLLSSRTPTKRDMARAAWDAVPAELLDRPKSGFNIPVREWLLADAPAQNERGLRGWAKTVYRHWVPTACPPADVYPVAA